MMSCFFCCRRTKSYSGSPPVSGETSPDSPGHEDDHGLPLLLQDSGKKSEEGETGSKPDICLQNNSDSNKSPREYSSEQNRGNEGNGDQRLGPDVEQRKHDADDGGSRQHTHDQCIDFSSGWGPLIKPIGRENSIRCLLKCSRSDYGSIACVNRSFRYFIRSGKIYELRRRYGIVEHWVYFSSLGDQWVALDVIRQRWMHLPKVSLDEDFYLSSEESLAVGTELLVLGSSVRPQVMGRYSLLSNSWSSLKLNVPRSRCASASLGEIAIFAGGFESRDNITNSAEMYNSETHELRTLPSMNIPRRSCSGVFMNGKFYAIGGIRKDTETWIREKNDSGHLSCGEEYDLETEMWTRIPNMSPGQVLGSPPSVAVVNDQLYAADYDRKKVKKFDMETKSWLIVERLPKGPSFSPFGSVFRGCGDRLIVIRDQRDIRFWVPSEGPAPLQWNLLAAKTSTRHCAVMGC